jgi:hypothetical protein
MRKFVLRSLAFLLPAILLLAAAEAYVRQLPNTYRYKDEWMWQHGPGVSTLLLGNSHAYYDLVPSVLGDSVFNLGNVSQRLEHDFYLLQRYADVCTDLRMVVQVADNSNLYDVPMEDDEPGRAAYYQLYMGYGKHAPLSRYGFELSSMTSFWGKVQKHFEDAALDCDSLGWGRNYQIELRNPDDFLPEHICEHLFHDSISLRENCTQLEAIARYCRLRHIRLVLLMPPVCRAYTLKADPRQLAYVQHTAQMLGRAYGAQVLDYSQDVRFTDEDFFDSDHLNDRGAMKFSEMLRKELLGQ